MEAFLTQVVLRHQVMSVAELREKQLDKPRDVDRDTWEWLLREVARRKAGTGPLAAGLEWVGREMMKGYVQGLVGKGVFMVARMLGPKRALLRMADNFSTGDDMTKVYASAKGDQHVELLFNDLGGMPTYIVGILSEALGQLGVTKHTVEFEERADGYTRFDVKW